VVLPASDRDLTHPDEPRPETPPGTGQAILVVEDEDAVREIVVRILTRSGYHVLQAATAKDALEVCTSPGVHIDALLTDVIMPEMTGPQLAERLRTVRADLPVLLMSGYTAGSLPGHRELAENLPLIRKPFDAATLLQHVRELLA
jgi:CheY-like chemotaxis protein